MEGVMAFKVIPALIFLTIIVVLMSLLAIIIPAINSSVLVSDPIVAKENPVQVWGVGLVSPLPIILIGGFMIGFIILIRRF
jgi:hypothetical protein